MEDVLVMQRDRSVIRSIDLRATGRTAIKRLSVCLSRLVFARQNFSSSCRWLFGETPHTFNEQQRRAREHGAAAASAPNENS
jgi:hypothetical protein